MKSVIWMPSTDIDYLIFNISKLYTENTNINLKKYNVTFSDMSFLFKLHENGKMNQKELAESKNLNTATITRALNRLEKKGFVKRENDSNDKRKKNIFLTQKGKEIVSDILIEHETFKKEIFKDFSSEEFLELVKYLNKLSESLENYRG